MAEDLKDYNIARREFVAVSVAAGLATAASVSAAEMEVVETDVEIKTPDGTCDAAFIHPKTGSHAGVLLWPDAFGLRPVTRAMGRRLAEQGYSVVVPNPFYRISKAPFSDASTFNFQNAADMAKLQPLMASVNAPGNAEKDAVAYIGFLDAQKEVDKSKKVGAGASFHGGGLVTANANSPHLLAPKIKAHIYFGIATNDDMKQPEAKDKLKEAFLAAHNPAKIEVYSESQHGWCMSDMPSPPGMPIYNKADAERAWVELTALYKKSLA
jgi:carboxymethylenebutenolidase